MKPTTYALLAGCMFLALRVHAQEATESPVATAMDYKHGIYVKANGPAYHALPEAPSPWPGPYACPCGHVLTPHALDRIALLEELIARMEAIMAEEKAKQQRDE